MAKKFTHSAEGLPAQDRFDSRLWKRYRTIVQLGNVRDALVLPGPGFLVAVASSRRTAMKVLRKFFPDPREARSVAYELGKGLA